VINNILLVFGTRPEAIKMAPLVHQLKQKKIVVKVCVTAQHREMLDQVLNFFEIIPDYDLDLMQPNQSLNELSSRIIHKMDAVFAIETFDWVLVHGDTTTSTMVALAAFHRGVKVGHVEAGLRTHDKYSPFPEELNRQLTARIADLHFAPTNKAKENLLKEQIPGHQIVVTGNTIVDALQWASQKMKRNYVHDGIEHLKNTLNSSKKMILVTGHRRENFGDGFQNICQALSTIAKREDVEIVFPVHLNPNVQKSVYELLSEHTNIHLLNPVEYPVMIWLMQQCSLIISDSGGIQEEAPSLGKPVLVTRFTSERAEGIEKGFAILVGTDTDKIIQETNGFLDTFTAFETIENPYGGGNPSEKISEYLMGL
jgi:UDP-N-acetylglucosamine 2-epimerase (non-hydrolysing)